MGNLISPVLGTDKPHPRRAHRRAARARPRPQQRIPQFPTPALSFAHSTHNSAPQSTQLSLLASSPRASAIRARLSDMGTTSNISSFLLPSSLTPISSSGESRPAPAPSLGALRGGHPMIPITHHKRWR
ncbi:hypothetical protein V8E36_003991 [Tilletia maclaganii]